VILWKSADQQGPPNFGITNYGWKMVDAFLELAAVNDTDVPAPPRLIDILSCGCSAAGKAGSYSSASA